MTRGAAVRMFGVVSSQSYRRRWLGKHSVTQLSGENFVMRVSAWLLIASVIVSLGCAPAMAGLVITLGEQDFTNGQIVNPFDYDDAQLTGEGSWDGSRSGWDDNTGPSYSKTWTFSYAFSDPIASASLTIGVFDHDSAMNAAEQVASLSVDGHDLTALLNDQFEAYGGTDSWPPTGMEYNIYTVSLPSSTFADLADGATFSLTLQNGWTTTFGDTLHNSAGLDFSTFDITAIPEPSTFFMMSAVTGVIVVGLGWVRHRKHAARGGS